MRLIAVGGQSKDIGKTTLICNIIAAFPHFDWTAIKFSTHAHPAINMELIFELQGASIKRQICPGDESDTARFLKAGAKHALFVHSETGSQKTASELLLKRLSSTSHVVVESTQAAEFLKPDLFLMLVGWTAGVKESSQKAIEHADAFISEGNKERYNSEIEKIASGRPIFEARRDRLDPELESLISALITKRF